jgi:hypothetical protein
MKQETSVLLADGRKLHFTQQVGESGPEFDGRVLYDIEAAILEGADRPVREGTRWAQWDHRGHPIRRFYAGQLGVIYESTGEPYANRKRRVPGLYNYDEACEALEIKHEG